MVTWRCFDACVITTHTLMTLTRSPLLPRLSQHTFIHLNLDLTISSQAEARNRSSPAPSAPFTPTSFSYDPQTPPWTSIAPPARPPPPLCPTSSTRKPPPPPSSSRGGQRSAQPTSGSEQKSALSSLSQADKPLRGADYGTTSPSHSPNSCSSPEPDRSRSSCLRSG
jgi:hypothetical protein